MKRTRAYVGSSRSFAIPVTFCITLRATPTWLIALTTGAKRGGDLALEVRAGEELGARRDLALLLLDRERPQHEPREVDHELLLALGHVRAHDVAELALVALVDDALVLAVGEHLHVVGAVVVGVDHLEQRAEARAQADADPAVAAGLERAVALGTRRGRVEIAGVEGVVERHATSQGEVRRPRGYPPRGRLDARWPHMVTRGVS